MATPTYVGSGALVDSVGSSALSFPSAETGDVFLVVVETANQSVAVSGTGGWTEVANSPQGTGTAGGTSATRITAYWMRWDGGFASCSVSDAGNHIIAIMYGFRGCKTSGDPFNVTSGNVDTSSDTSLSATGATTTAANCLVCVLASCVDDAQNFGATWTNSDLTAITVRANNPGTAGNDGRHVLVTGVKAAAGTYGATTNTLTASSVKAMMTIAFEGTADNFSGDGSPTVPKPSIAATAALIFAGTAALSVPQSSVSATGGTSEPVTGTAALTVPVSSVAASGQVIFAGTGALTVPSPSVSSTATFIANAGSAALTVPIPTVAGTGLESFAGTGAIAVPAPVVAGAGLETFTGTAGLTAVAQVSATGAHDAGAGFEGAAGLIVPAPSIAASGTQTFSGTGALDVPAIAVTGTGTEAFAASAALSVPAVSVSGTGLESFPGTAALTVPAPPVAGIGSTSSGVAALGVPQSSVAASGNVVGFVGTGTLVVPKPLVVGLPGGQLPFRALAVDYALVSLNAAHEDIATLLMRHAASNALNAAPEDAVEQASRMDTFTTSTDVWRTSSGYWRTSDSPMRYT